MPKSPKRRAELLAAVVPLPGENDTGEGTTLAAAAQLIGDLKFLIADWVVIGMLNGVIAQPGVGKSAFVLGGIVKPIVNGCGKFFNGQPGPVEPGKVLLVATENDAAITIKRCRGWGVSIGQIVLPFPDDPLRAADLTDKDDLEQIERVALRHRVLVIVVDSLRGSHGGDENNSTVVAVLKSLAAIAERLGIAIIVIHHTRKMAVDEEMNANSSRGSNAITSMFRAQIGIEQPDPNDNRRRVRMLKENLGAAPKPIGFEITESGLNFGPAPEPPNKRSLKDTAADWLRERMKPGEVYKAADLVSGAEQYGHTKRNISKAIVEKLKIKPKPVYVDGKIDHWVWELPTRYPALLKDMKESR